MNSIKQQIEADIKTAMLAGDKTRVTTLRSLKSAILYAEVAQGSRETGLSDPEVIDILSKESKKRQESADLYRQGRDEVRAAAELAEKEVISTYLPKQLTDDELVLLINEAIATTGATGPQAMGQVIGYVKAKVGAAAEGSRIAGAVKERLVVSAPSESDAPRPSVAAPEYSVDSQRSFDDVSDPSKHSGSGPNERDGKTLRGKGETKS